MTTICACGCMKEVNRGGRYYWGHTQKGARHWKYKGGRIKDKDGYIIIKRPFHPYRNARGYYQHHRLVLEAYYSIKFGIPIYILPCLVVHHKDGNKQNNTIDNLEIMDKRSHDRLSKTDYSNRLCIECGSNKTYMDRKKQPRWHKYENGFRCVWCYQREYNRKRLNAPSLE